MLRPDNEHPIPRTARGLALALALIAGAAPPVLAGPSDVVQSDPFGARRGGDGVGGIEKTGGPQVSGPTSPNGTGGPGPTASGVEQPTDGQAWSDLGGELSGNSHPELNGSGDGAAGSTLALDLHGGPAHAAVTLILGTSVAPQPFAGGTLMPAPQLLLAGLGTDAAGGLHLQATLPAGLPAGFELVVQYWLEDDGAPQGLAASNALLFVAP